MDSLLLKSCWQTCCSSTIASDPSQLLPHAKVRFTSVSCLNFVDESTKCFSDKHWARKGTSTCKHSNSHLKEQVFPLFKVILFLLFKVISPADISYFEFGLMWHVELSCSCYKTGEKCDWLVVVWSSGVTTTMYDLYVDSSVHQMLIWLWCEVPPTSAAFSSQNKLLYFCSFSSAIYLRVLGILGWCISVMNSQIVS